MFLIKNCIKVLNKSPFPNPFAFEYINKALTTILIPCDPSLIETISLRYPNALVASVSTLFPEPALDREHCHNVLARCSKPATKLAPELGFLERPHVHCRELPYP